VNLRRFSTLQIALGISLAAHAVLLTLRFVDPTSVRRVFQDTPLEVILVNARSNERPDKAKAIAQFAMAGGGDAAKGRATSPLPPTVLMDKGDSLEDQTQQRLQSLLKQQTILLTQKRQELAALPVPDPRQRNLNAEQAEREEKRRLLLKQLAEIEKRINQDNTRPRKRYLSPATRDEVYALYYDRLRHTIEDKGTESFPQAGGKKLYGELMMILTVNFDGRLVSAEVAESSGNRLLDRRAEAIARNAAPFGRFTRDMRNQADQIVVVSRFKFTREETLETRVSTP